jgi:proteic killer suppression protein
VIRKGVIQSYRDERARLILVERRAPKGFATTLLEVTRRKLVQLNAATSLADLGVPPGNRLESLKGELSGRHSIRINDQWRIVFRWTDAGPVDVETMDYH